VSGVTKSGVRFNRESNPKSAEAYKAMTKSLKGLHDGDPLQPPYEVELTFSFEPPRKRSWPRSGDIDKYARLVLDALTKAGVIEDDRHVLVLSSKKVYGDPGTAITVHEVH